MVSLGYECLVMWGISVRAHQEKESGTTRPRRLEVKLKVVVNDVTAVKVHTSV